MVAAGVGAMGPWLLRQEKDAFGGGAVTKPGAPEDAPPLPRLCVHRGVMLPACCTVGGMAGVRLWC